MGAAAPKTASKIHWGRVTGPRVWRCQNDGPRPSWAEGAAGSGEATGATSSATDPPCSSGPAPDQLSPRSEGGATARSRVKPLRGSAGWSQTSSSREWLFPEEPESGCSEPQPSRRGRKQGTRRSPGLLLRLSTQPQLSTTLAAPRQRCLLAAPRQKTELPSTRRRIGRRSCAFAHCKGFLPMDSWIYLISLPSRLEYLDPRW